MGAKLRVVLVGVLVVVITAAAVGIIWNAMEREQQAQPPAPTTSIAAARTAPTRGQKTVRIAALASPNLEAAASAPAGDVAKLIADHNAAQQRLQAVSLRGLCTWIVDDDEGEPRSMTIERRGSDDRVAITCAQNRCVVRANTISYDADSAMQVDGLYAVMFRMYDPARFQAGAAAGANTVATAENESLEFDAATGRLVCASLRIDQGTLVARYSDYVALRGDEQAMVPSVVRISVPPSYFPFEVKGTGTIRFTIDSDRSRIITPPAK